MPEYVLMSRGAPHGTLVRGVEDALYIPAGMQGHEDAGLGQAGAAMSAVGQNLMKKMMARGMSQVRARALVGRAVSRVHRSRRFAHPLRQRKIMILPKAPLPYAIPYAMKRRGTGKIRFGMGDSWTEAFFGKPQSFYNALSAAENHAVAIQAEISGIGKDAWDAALQTSRLAEAGWVPFDTYSYDAMMKFWLENTRRLNVKRTPRPEQADINEVNKLATGTEKLIALIKEMVPAADRAKGEADRVETQKILAGIGPMTSPSDVGKQSLKEDLVKGASGLLGAGLLTTAVAAVIAIALLGALK